ncbi:MAG TPA: transposase [Thiolinea sp.]|nr:transposase [uncultured Thiothrix sp.]HMT91853.1 transposase [Thiolinea sp.]
MKTLKLRIKDQHASVLNRDELVKAYAAIFIGDVSSKALAKTKMAKSVLNAGWGSFKTMLRYKCVNAGVWFEEVNEKYTTQACSSCGSISVNSPKGRAGLRIREWTYPDNAR